MTKKIDKYYRDHNIFRSFIYFFLHLQKKF
jgi:hypothetical protein